MRVNPRFYRPAEVELLIGSPAKAVRQLSPEQIEGLRQSAQHYIDNARKFRATLKKL